MKALTPIIRILFLRSLPLVLLSLMLAPLAPLHATEKVTIQRRLSQRLPAIDAIKLSGRVGENRNGYLEARGELTKNEEKLVDEENGDRRKIFAIVSIKTNTATTTVGATRARQIVERSRRGIWLQNESGEWFQK
jgi:hypothetical protein